MRIRSNNCFGTVTDDPLTDSATTLNSAGLANLAAVTGSDEAIITLDPNRVNGAPEIVRVTAHTGSATSATIDRGEFGTVAREHPAGTAWVHGPVAATSSDPDGDFGGFWEDYTPTHQNITVGNGTQVAKFTRIGNTVFWEWTLTFGSGTAFTGTIGVGLPVDAGTAGKAVGSGNAFDDGTRMFVLTTEVSGTTTQTRVVHTETAGSGRVDATSPFTWVTGDDIRLGGSYRVA